MITYQVETWDEYFKDCQELWKEHYDEIAVNKDGMPMEPNIPSYIQLEKEGILHILTVRENGKMIGYHVSFVRTHIHYASVLCAFGDAYFLTAGKRKGMVGVKLIREFEKSVKKRGVKKLFSGTKKSINRLRVYEYLGWSSTEDLVTKWIGD